MPTFGPIGGWTTGQFANQQQGSNQGVNPPSVSVPDGPYEVGRATGLSTTASLTTTIVLPALVAGDLILLAAEEQGNATSITADTGFNNPLVSAWRASANLSVWALKSAAGAESGATVTVTSAGSRLRAVVALVLRGAGNVEVFNFDISPSTSNNVNAPPVAPITPGDIIVGFHGIATAVVRTPWSGWTLDGVAATAGPQIDTGVNANGSALACFYDLNHPDTSSTGTLTATPGAGAVNQWASVTLAITPLGAIPPSPGPVPNLSVRRLLNATRMLRRGRQAAAPPVLAGQAPPDPLRDTGLATPTQVRRRPFGRPMLRRAVTAMPPLVGQAPPDPLRPVWDSRRIMPVARMRRRAYTAQPPLVGLAPPQPPIPQSAPARRIPIHRMLRRDFTSTPPFAGTAPPQPLLDLAKRRRAPMPPRLLRRASTAMPPLAGQAPPQPLADLASRPRRPIPLARMLRRGVMDPTPFLVAIPPPPAVQGLPPEPRRPRRISPSVLGQMARRRRTDEVPARIGRLINDAGDDHSFDTSVGHWIGLAGTTLAWSTTRSVNGSGCLKGTSTAGGNVIPFRYPAGSGTTGKIGPGDTLQITGWYYQETNAASSWTINVGWTTAANQAATAPTLVSLGGGQPTGQWIPFTARWTVPSVPGLAQMSADFTMNGTNVNDVFYLDAVEMRVISHVLPQFTPVGWPAANQDRRNRRPNGRMQRRATTWQPSVTGLPLYGADTSSFEGSVGGWTGASATVVQDPTQAFMGTQSLKMTATAGPTTAQAIGPQKDLQAITGYGPGVRLRLVTWVYCETNGRTIGLACNFANPNTGFFGGTNTQVGVGQGAWTQITTTATVPSAPGIYRVQAVVFAGSPATNDVFYIDAVQVEVIGFTAPSFAPAQWTAHLARRLPLGRMQRRAVVAAPPVMVGLAPPDALRPVSPQPTQKRGLNPVRMLRRGVTAAPPVLIGQAPADPLRGQATPITVRRKPVKVLQRRARTAQPPLIGLAPPDTLRPYTNQGTIRRKPPVQKMLRRAKVAFSSTWIGSLIIIRPPDPNSPLAFKVTAGAVTTAVEAPSLQWVATASNMATSVTLDPNAVPLQSSDMASTVKTV